MSKIKNMPGVAWLVIGILVTLLVIPSTAYAAALKFTGIEGSPSGNKADVTGAGQLLTTEAQPPNLFGNSTSDVGEATVNSGGSSKAVILNAPSDQALVMNELVVDVSAWTSTATVNTWYELYISTNSCAGEVEYWYEYVNPTGLGSTQFPLTPGVPIPAGDALCVTGNSGTGTFELYVSATGSLVPSASVPNVRSLGLPHLGPMS
jgi:hypothetical protein